MRTATWNLGQKQAEGTTQEAQIECLRIYATKEYIRTDYYYYF